MSDDKVLVPRGQLEKIRARAEIFDDGSDGADAESARSVSAIIDALLAQPSDGALTNEGAEPVAFYMGDAMDIERLTKKQEISRHIRNEQLGPMGATIVTEYQTNIGLRLVTEYSNGGCSAYLYPAVPASPAPPKVCTCPSGDGSLRCPCPVHPPEVKALVLPERKIVLTGVLSESNTHNHGWNACLDRVKELNS